MHCHSAVKILVLMFVLILAAPQLIPKGQKDLQQRATVVSAPRTRLAAGLQAVGPTQGQIRENSKDGLKYVWIPPGTFTMGCSTGDNDCFDQEKPAHSVTITRGFWIGQTPVTAGAYKRFAGVTGRQMPPARRAPRARRRAGSRLAVPRWPPHPPRR